MWAGKLCDLKIPIPKKIMFNFLKRHGSRFPTVSDITKLNQLKRTLLSHQELLNKTDYLWMVNWTDPYQFQTAGNLDNHGIKIILLRLHVSYHLNSLGELEQYGIAKRVREEYNISVPCCDTVYPIQTTQIPR